jgi:hypothetical protein
MCLTILTYALCTGLSALSQTWWHLLTFRFLAAMGIGGEWAAGVALVSETWPRRWRAWTSPPADVLVRVRHGAGDADRVRPAREPPVRVRRRRVARAGRLLDPPRPARVRRVARGRGRAAAGAALVRRPVPRPHPAHDPPDGRLVLDGADDHVDEPVLGPPVPPRPARHPLMVSRREGALRQLRGDALHPGGDPRQLRRRRAGPRVGIPQCGGPDVPGGAGLVGRRLRHPARPCRDPLLGPLDELLHGGRFRRLRAVRPAAVPHSAADHRRGLQLQHRPGGGRGRHGRLRHSCASGRVPGRPPGRRRALPPPRWSSRCSSPSRRPRERAPSPHGPSDNGI